MLLSVPQPYYWWTTLIEPPWDFLAVRSTIVLPSLARRRIQLLQGEPVVVDLLLHLAVAAVLGAAAFFAAHVVERFHVPAVSVAFGVWRMLPGPGLTGAVAVQAAGPAGHVRLHHAHLLVLACSGGTQLTCSSTLATVLALRSFPMTTPPVPGWILFASFFHVYLYVILVCTSSLLLSTKTSSLLLPLPGAHSAQRTTSAWRVWRRR